MLLKPLPPNIDAVDPFKDDLLDRKDYVVSIVELIKISKGNAVISIEGKWGTGKTTVAQMIKAVLSRENNNAIYYDAYRNDYLEAGSLGILSSLYAEIKKDDTAIVSKAGLLDATKHISVALVKVGLGIGVRALTSNLVNPTQAGDEIAKAVTDGANDKIISICENSLDDYLKSQSDLAAFRTALSNFAKEKRDSGKGPLVVLVDELDRCRPRFSVSFIETIKVLFDVDNVVFVLFVNPRQLEVAIRNEYGNGIDAVDYLHKFVDARIALPESANRIGHNLRARFVGTFKNKFQIADENLASSIHNGMSDLANYYQCSLREIERVYIISMIAAHRHGKMFVVNQSLLAVVLAYMKVKDPEFLHGISHGHIETDRLREWLQNRMITRDRSPPGVSTKCYYYFNGLLSIIDNKRDSTKPIIKGFDSVFMFMSGDAEEYLSSAAGTIDNCGCVG